MRKMHFLCCVLLSVGMLICSGYAMAGTIEKGATVARFAKAPVIDGKLDAGEWDKALRTVGFQNYWDGLISCRMGSTYFGFTDDRLYFAMVSEMPPNGKLRAEQKYRDSEVVGDECLEIWIDPNRGTRSAGGDKRYYSFLVNPNNVIRDVCYDPTKGTPDTGWNGNWEVANGIDKASGMWITEVSIPVVDLGLKPGDMVGRTLGILQARNYKAGWWLQATWFRHGNAGFDTWPEYPTIVLTKDSPTVAIESLGDKLHTGELDLKAKVYNPGAARQAKVDIYLATTDMPELKDSKVIDLPAGGFGEYTLFVPSGRLHEDAIHTLDMKVSSVDGQDTWFSYIGKWTKAPEVKWPGGYGGPNPDAAVQLAYYPSYKFIRLKLDPRDLGDEAANIASGTVTVKSPDGKSLLSEKLTWKDLPYVQEFNVPDLPDGEYTATVVLDGWKDSFDRKFVRKHFPWEGNKLGITDKVLPPFEPVKVKGNAVDVVLRTYKMNGLGLWDSVKSLGRELLAGPIEIKVNEKVIKGKGKITSTNPQAAVFEGTADAPGVTVKTRATTEYDGCMKVELDLLPSKKPQEVKSLWLEIPVKDSEAHLWHVSTAGLRVNPAGATPSGEGVVWDSRQFADGNWYGNFKPYIWVGGEERGICWFADNDKGWELDVDLANPNKSAPCLMLIRKNGVLTVRVNIIQKPVTITEPRQIDFGLMASPAKPMVSDWRRTNYGWWREGYQNINHMGSEYWGSDYPCASKYPRNGDMSIIDAMTDCRLGKPVDVAAFQKEWKERNLRPDQPLGGKDGDHMLGLIKVSLDMAGNAGRRDQFTVYWEEFHSTSGLHEEVNTFQNEWSGTYGYGSTGGLVPSYQDFACWWGAEFVKRGMGLYFDNAFPKRAYDPMTSSAYKLPNGDIQPSAGIWAHREYLRRIWVIHKTMGHPELPINMMIHMTNTNIIPYMVWSDSLLDLEWFYGPEPQQSKYAHEMLRAQSLGRQAGSVPLVLAYIDSCKSPEEQAFAERTRFGTMMVHEIRVRMGREDSKLMEHVFKFGYGMDDCEVFNYWDEKYPVKMSNEQVKSILLKRGNELLLVVATWNQKPEKVKVSLDTKVVGVAVSSVVNEENPDETYVFDAATGSFDLDLEGYGVRVIRLR